MRLILSSVHYVSGMMWLLALVWEDWHPEPLEDVVMALVKVQMHSLLSAQRQPPPPPLKLYSLVNPVAWSLVLLQNPGVSNSFLESICRSSHSFIYFNKMPCSSHPLLFLYVLVGQAWGTPVLESGRESVFFRKCSFMWMPRHYLHQHRFVGLVAVSILIEPLLFDSRCRPSFEH